MIFNFSGFELKKIPELEIKDTTAKLLDTTGSGIAIAITAVQNETCPDTDFAFSISLA